MNKLLATPLAKNKSSVSCRSISNYLYYNIPTDTYYHSQLSSNHTKKFNAKFKIPLLKSSQYFGHHSSRLNRFTNEDAYSAAILSLPINSFNPDIGKLLSKRYVKASEDKDTNLQVFNFNVFDGHGSDLVSKYLAGNLSKIVENYEFENLTKEHLKEIIAKYHSFFKEQFEVQMKAAGVELRRDPMRGSYWNKWLKSVDKVYSELYAKCSTEMDDLQLRLLFSYLELDYDLMSNPKLIDPKKSKFDFIEGGSTATSIFLYNLQSNSSNNHYFDNQSIAKLVVSHLGDTRCVIVDKFGTAHGLTNNHHPDSPSENSRLTKLTPGGGLNFGTDSFGEQRYFNLANTRAFGDFPAKNRGITAEPEITSLVIGNSHYIAKNAPELRDQTVGGIGGDEAFIILVSDGVTNFCNDQEMADLIMSNFNLKGIDVATPQYCAQELVNYVEAVGGDDNTTCLILRLSGWGNWPIMDRTGKIREAKLNDAVFANRRSGTG